MIKKQVGQIIFILSHAEMSLIPVLVVEEIVRRTIEGEEVNYFVEMVGNAGARKRFALDSSKYKIFDDIYEAKDHLSRNALDAIEVLCAKAIQKSEFLLNSTKKDKNLHEEDVPQYEEMLLEDGTRVKINLQKVV